jgi:hypothetical protein
MLGETVALVRAFPVGNRTMLNEFHRGIKGCEHKLMVLKRYDGKV